MELPTLVLPPQAFVLSTKNITCLALLHNGLKATKEAEFKLEKENLKQKGKPDSHIPSVFSRRIFPDWINDQLTTSVGKVFNSEGELLWDNLCEGHDHIGQCTACMNVDQAFNDDASFRWVSTFSDYALKPPKRNRLHLIQYRVELITAAFIIAGQYDPQIEGWENPFAV